MPSAGSTANHRLVIVGRLVLKFLATNRIGETRQVHCTEVTFQELNYFRRKEGLLL